MDTFTVSFAFTLMLLSVKYCTQTRIFEPMVNKGRVTRSLKRLEYRWQYPSTAIRVSTFVAFNAGLNLML